MRRSRLLARFRSNRIRRRPDPVVSRRIAAWCMLAALVVVLAWIGGAGGPARAVGMSLVALGLAIAALTASSQARLPRLGWILALCAVPILWPLAQVAPLGWAPTWSAPDRALLDVSQSWWALDRQATERSVMWGIGFAGALLLASWAWQGRRLSTLAGWVVGIAAVHAVIALGLSVLWPEFPNQMYFSGRVRGTFVYPNQAAAFWAATLPLALLLIRADDTHRRWWLAAALVLGTAIVLSASRGGIMVAALVSGPALWLALPRRRRWAWALAVVALASVWLWIAGLQEVQERISALSGVQGTTLNGRVKMWESAVKMLPEVGAAGLGTHGGRWAFLAGGEIGFGSVIIDFLHSDPLEWLVECGWAGTAAAALGIAVALWMVLRRRRAAPTSDRVRRAIALGAGLGLLHLAIHSCGDVIWQREALPLLAVCLLVLWAGAGIASTAEHRRPTWRLRILLGVAALAVGWAAWTEYGLGTAYRLAWDARTTTAQRAQSKLSPSTATIVQQACTNPLTADAAVLAAEILLKHPPDDMPRDEVHRRAREALAIAARLRPSDPDAWVLRLRLAMLTGDLPTLTAAVNRVRVLTPGNAEARSLLCLLLMAENQVILPLADQRALIEQGLRDDWTPPSGFWHLAERLLGLDAVLAAIAQADPQVVRSAEPWLTQEGPLEAWIAARRRIAPRQPETPPARAQLDRALLGDGILVQTSRFGEGMAQQALALDDLLLPWPEELTRRLADSENPFALLAAAPGSLAMPRGDPTAWLEVLSAHGLEYGRWLHVPIGKRLYTQGEDARAILAGRTRGIGVGARPALIYAAWQRCTDPAERGRLELSLRNQCGTWTDAAGGATACWWWPPAELPPFYAPGWMGVVVDGRWLGWQRGIIEMPAVDQGLHRVVLLSAP
jgi:hypothetical protein